MKFITITLVLNLLLSFQITAQHVRFTQQGEIQYEKKVNMFALLRSFINKDNEAYMQRTYDQYKASQPQFVTTKSVLTFSRNESLYKAAETGGSPPQNSFAFFPGVNQINVVHNNYTTHSTTIQKTVFEQVFLVKDNTRKIKWKITDETREIAGYQCRRANALVMDSIYVVAFYSDKIPVSGGPETFSGLPGMILGVALPHDHISWFATKVTDAPVAKTSLQAPAKGKAVDNTGLKETLQKAFKQWGQQAQLYFKFFVL